MEYRIAKTKKDFKSTYSFRREIYKNKQTELDYKDIYDERKRTINFIAIKNDEVFANVRLIKGVRKSNGFSLPMEKHFKLLSYKKDNILPAEFSQMLISDKNNTGDMIIKFLTFVFQYADRHSIKYLYTLANTGTDDPESVRTVYKIARVKNQFHPHIKTSQKKENKEPDDPVLPLYNRGIIAMIKEYISFDYKRLAVLEKQGLHMPYNIQLYTKLGFQITSIPIFIPNYKKYVLPMVLEIEKAKIKNLKYDFNKKESLIPKKEITCRAANSVIQYVKSRNGDIHKLLKGINYSEEYFFDENNWIDCKTVIKLFRNARLLLKDSEIGYKIGYSSGQLNSIGIFNTLYKLFSTPLITFKMSSNLSKLWNRVQTFKTIVIKKNKVNIIVSKGHLLPSKEICDLTKGLSMAIPHLWNLKTKVNEVECVRRGDKHCRYQVEWEGQKSLIRKIYYSTIDKFITLIEAGKILKQKQQLNIKKYSELKQKNYENKKLIKLLDQKNIKLQETINNKINELKIIYRKKLKQEEIIHNKEKTDIMENLTGIIAHEIKSSLSSVNLLYSEFLKNNLINKNRGNLLHILNTYKNIINKPDIVSTLDNIKTINRNYNDIDFTINHTNKTIKETFELCKSILNNYSQYDKKKETINSLLTEFYNNNRSRYNKHDIHLRLNLQNHNNIKYNKNHISTLVQNIISNSYNALICQKDNKSKKIEIKTIIEDNDFIIKIKDNGPGIPEKHQSQILKPFYTTSAKKTGLGLPFCNKIIKQYNGDIKFSTSPEGTTFNIFLPLGEIK